MGSFCLWNLSPDKKIQPTHYYWEISKIAEQIWSREISSPLFLTCTIDNQ
jgi:hypothetical protein